MWRHWYKPTFWRWWWQTQADAGAKAITAVVAAAVGVFAGYELTGVFSSASAARVYTYVQTLRNAQDEPVTTARPVTVRVHGAVVTVDPPPRTVPGETVREFVTATTYRSDGVTRTQTVHVGRGRVVTVAAPVKKGGAAVTRPVTVSHPSTVTVSRVATATGPPRTVTVQRAAGGQTVTEVRTLTQTAPAATVTRSASRSITVPVTTTVPVTSTVTREETATVVRPTTQTVVVTTTTTVPVTTTVARTITLIQTVLATLTRTTR